MNCDNIIVMGDGVVKEQGTHQALLSDPNSTYSQMWRDFLRSKEELGDEIDEELTEVKHQIEN